MLFVWKKKIDISVLFEPPKFSTHLSLSIFPLAALSMVQSMPGKYYRSERSPSKFMIYGMLENLLGWHWEKETREKILKDIQGKWKKKKLETPNKESSQVGFVPLLQHHIKVKEQAGSFPIHKYLDYWTQHVKGADKRHLDGAKNEDWRLSAILREEKEKGKDDTKNGSLDNLFKEYNGYFPNYYSRPILREFLIIKDGFYVFNLETNEKLANMILEASEALANPLYLGTNEGWIDIEIKKMP